MVGRVLGCGAADDRADVGGDGEGHGVLHSISKRNRTDGCCMKIKVSAIKESKFKLRSSGEQESLKELAQSIRLHGLLQPIKVRPLNDEFEIVYGHRRVAAMRLLGWSECEALVEGVDDRESHLQALIENLQRDDMSEVEKGRAFLALKERHGLSNQEIAEAVGKSKSVVDMAVQVVTVLPESVQERVRAAGMVGTPTEPTGITSFHAQEMTRLRGVSPQVFENVAQKVLSEGLSGRQTRELTKALKAAPDEATRAAIIDAPFARTGDEVAREVKLDQVIERLRLPRAESLPTLDEKLYAIVRPVSDGVSKIEKLNLDDATLEVLTEVQRRAVLTYVAMALDRLVRAYQRLERRLVADVRNEDQSEANPTGPHRQRRRRPAKRLDHPKDMR